MSPRNPWLVRQFVEEDISAEQPKQRWSINLGWFLDNGRSFSTLALGSLCAVHQRQFAAEGAEPAAAELMAAIRDCCSKKSGFISRELPVLESLFRLFLASGNQPLDLDELSQKLGEWCGWGVYRSSPQVLSRLLTSDCYYGLTPLPE